MTTTSVATSIRRYQLAGLAIVVATFGGLGGWAAIASIAGAVVAPASIVVESSAKKVQHLEGGIIAAIHVVSGDHVTAGEPLFRLDDTEARANLQIYRAQLVELKARQARLLAERDGRSELDRAEAEPGSDWVWDGQAKLLEARRVVRTGKELQLGERIGQLEQVSSGLAAQVAAKERQITLIGKELKSLYTLRDNQLVTQSRWLALERELARLEGERGQLVAEVARTAVQIGETRLQHLGVQQTFLSEVLAELRDVETKVNELTEKVAAILAQLQRSTIAAPRAGIVHKLTTTTIGGVIRPGEVIAEIVPEEDRLVVEGRVDPGSIDRLSVGQATIVRFPTLDHHSTPERTGHVTMISPEPKQDAPGQPHYFLVRVDLDRGDALLPGHALQPGLPAELNFQTGERTVLSYLVKPITDQLARAMRER
jgi:membrane fusion protein, type I secretion system